MYNLFYCVFVSFIFAMGGLEGVEDSHYVLVSVAPYKAFVENIAGNTVQVGVMVPAGASIHTYEPTPREMLAASKADLWFMTGEAFEAKAARAFKNHNPAMEFIDLKQGVDLISNDPHYDAQHCCKHCLDLHIWLSPKQAKIQAKAIAQTLIKRYPESRKQYEENLQKFLDQLDALDRSIEATLKPLKNRTILVSHPAYAYFCRDYNLKQLSIEYEGKDPTPHQLTQVMEQARRLQIKTIFIQPQYNNKGARLIADHIGAKVVSLNPYAENYFASMEQIAHAFASQ